MPMFLQFLLLEYTFSGCLLIMSGVILHILPCAFMLRPLNPPLKQISCCNKKETKEDILLSANESFNTSKKIPVISYRRPSDSSSVSINYPKDAVRDKKLERQIIASFHSTTSLTGSISDLGKPVEAFSSTRAYQNVDPSRRRHNSNTGKSGLFLDPGSPVKMPSSSHYFPLNNLENSPEKPLISPRCAAIRSEVNKKVNRSCSLSESKPSENVGLIDAINMTEFKYEPRISSSAGDVSKTLDSKIFGSSVQIPISNASPNSFKKELTENDHTLILQQHQKEEESNLQIASKIKKEKRSVKSVMKSFFTSIANYFDGEVLKSPRMISMLLCSCLLSMGTPHVLTFLHAHFRLIIIIYSEKKIQLKYLQ